MPDERPPRPSDPTDAVAEDDASALPDLAEGGPGADDEDGGARRAVCAVMALMHEGAAMLDGEGRVLHCNAGLCDMLQRSAASLMGKSFASLVHPADAAKWQAAFSGQGDAAPLGFTLDVLAGKDRPVPVHVAVCRLPAGDLAFLVASDLAWHEERMRQFEKANADLEAQLESLQIAATTDSMTGAYTSGALMDVLRTELAYGRRYNSSVSMLLIDVDYFKSLNDSYGHAFGDSVLREFCDRAKDAIRGTDYLVRYGGDEFAVILPRTDAAGARAVGQRILNSVRGKPFGKERREVPVTISMGVVTAEPGETVSAADVLKRADSALYEVKNAGRNGLAFWSSKHRKA